MYSIVKFLILFLPIINSFAKSDTFSEKKTSLENITLNYNDFVLKNSTITAHKSSSSPNLKYSEVDCFGLGVYFAKSLDYFFKHKGNNDSILFTHFYMLSRKMPRRVHVYLGNQFGLEWTDFNIRRKTIVIVHGFLSAGNESWIQNMEKAFLLLGDVNIVVVDWSEGSNTWIYYKAAINTKVVGSLIAKLFDHIGNYTINSQGPPEDEWGGIHCVGHSLGAHICSFASNEIKKLHSKWKVERITGLDPAQPCFQNVDMSLFLDKNDAPFVDVIHTNGKLLSSLGLGIPQPVGHVDFYPNGGKTQPGCLRQERNLHLPLPQAVINQAICSHGRSHAYFTESILTSVEHNCTFWAHYWDLTFRNVLSAVKETCNPEICSEMGINSINYPQRGTFFILTSGSAPHCNVKETDKKEVLDLLSQDLQNELDD